MFQFVFFALLPYFCSALDNGVARTPVMGWSTWNLYHRDFTEQMFYDAVKVFESTPMKSVGYEYINVDGGWWYSVNKTVVRNSTGYAYVDPVKYPNGIKPVIDYIHAHGLKYGHYTNAGTNACDGDAQMSQYYMQQDISLFLSWNIDMIKVDACAVKGNDTQVIFKWRDALNATGRNIVFSDCRNQCLASNWERWCVDLANMWRISADIGPLWNKMLNNLDALKSYGRFAEPGAWNDPDLLEIDIGDFAYDATQRSLRMNQAHFSLWCIVSAPLIVGMNLTEMNPDILDMIVNINAIAVNQNYLYHGGDIITEFDGISNAFKAKYAEEMARNENNTELFYKPLPDNIGNAAFVFLNRGTQKGYNVSLDFNELPLVDNHSTVVKCVALDIWTNEIGKMSSFQALLPPQSVKFVLLKDCVSTFF